MRDWRISSGLRWALGQIFSVFLGSKGIGTMFKSPPYEKHILLISQRHFVRSRLKQVQVHNLGPLILGCSQHNSGVENLPVSFSQFTLTTVTLAWAEPSLFCCPPHTRLKHSPRSHKTGRKGWVSLDVVPLMQTDLCVTANKSVCKAQITGQSASGSSN